MSSVPEGSAGDRIRRGALLFNETPVYAAEFTPSKISCAHCHIEGGVQAYASPVVGAPGRFPQFNERAGHVISLEDRVEECMVRSENGKPLAYDSDQMLSLVAYMKWLSVPQPGTKAFVGKGLIAVPDLVPDVAHGAQIYAAQCAGCHGRNGEGHQPSFPPLWGKDSFNDGAGMWQVKKMAAFVQHNMPENRKGILSLQDAFDVAAFVHAQPRPAFDAQYKHF